MLKIMKMKVNAVERTIKLLEYLTRPNCKKQLNEIAKEVELNKSTTFRFLNTLIELGYVRKNDITLDYIITEKINNLLISSTPLGLLQNAAIPILQVIADITNETIHLAILEKNNIHYIYKIESSQVLRVSTISHRGRIAPIYSTALGKALLAFMPKDKSDNIINSITLKKITDNTIDTKDELFKELSRIRENGYSCDDEENEKGVYCIANVIRNSRDEILAAFSITGPSSRMKENKEAHIALIKEMALKINNSL